MLKFELGFSTNGLIRPLLKALGVNCPKLVFRPQTYKISSYFQILGVMSVYSQKIAKTFKNRLFGAISGM